MTTSTEQSPIDFGLDLPKKWAEEPPLRAEAEIRLLRPELSPN